MLHPRETPRVTPLSPPSDPDPAKGKMLLVRILKTLVTKFGTLRSYMERVEEAELQNVAEQEQVRIE
jgi:hypothetical protein